MPQTTEPTSQTPQPVSQTLEPTSQTSELTPRTTEPVCRGHPAHPDKLSLSLSLTHTHTHALTHAHTHTHTQGVMKHRDSEGKQSSAEEKRKFQAMSGGALCCTFR